MRIESHFIILCCVIFSCYAFAQQEIKMTISEYNKEKEAILNTIINSVPFDSINSIYSDPSSHFVFAKNEILKEDIPITLMYKNLKVEIVDCSQTKENCWLIGDFFLNIYTKNPKEARVQIVLIRENKSIEETFVGIMLDKHKKWQIRNFTLID